MSPQIYDAIVSGWRIVLLALLPIMGCIAVASILVTIVQTVTGTKEPTIPLLARLLALVIGLYLFVPSASASLSELLTTALTTPTSVSSISRR